MNPNAPLTAWYPVARDAARGVPGPRAAVPDKVAVEIAFDPAWRHRRTGAACPLDAAERDTPRHHLAAIVDEAVDRTLHTRDGWPPTDPVALDAPGLHPRGIDLCVDAHGTNSPPGVQVCTASTGRTSQRADRLDSESGQVLARVANPWDHLLRGCANRRVGRGAGAARPAGERARPWRYAGHRP